ncbi:604_t:CDS:2 [Funneliformis mosseae]|uniref:604_t:CDS:1 n=1 Tax=Funneliformis mosseae TaxID=27381 RepID=A0A9N8WE35_FUNMO|nr:604_t:CDS:2 [Funneliformis mosseae]
MSGLESISIFRIDLRIDLIAIIVSPRFDSKIQLSISTNRI